MEKMSIMEMKHEMDVLVHLNQVINDFVDMMGLRILTHIDPQLLHRSLQRLYQYD